MLELRWVCACVSQHESNDVFVGYIATQSKVGTVSSVLPLTLLRAAWCRLVQVRGASSPGPCRPCDAGSRKQGWRRSSCSCWCRPLSVSRRRLAQCSHLNTRMYIIVFVHGHVYIVSKDTGLGMILAKFSDLFLYMLLYKLYQPFLWITRHWSCGTTAWQAVYLS